MRMYHVRLDKEMRIADALTFMAADRQAADEAFAGDIIGLHNHGTINIGDTFTEGEKLTFTGIPNFAPEMFRRAVLKDPLKMKQLAKGLDQLCEEGATQLFKPLRNNDMILGAVGQLQFEVVAFRLQDEYAVAAVFDTIGVHTARWVYCDDEKHLEEFRTKAYDNLAIDHSGALVYLAPSRVNLELTIERWPKISFRATRESQYTIAAAVPCERHFRRRAGKRSAAAAGSRLRRHHRHLRRTRSAGHLHGRGARRTRSSKSTSSRLKLSTRLAVASSNPLRALRGLVVLGLDQRWYCRRASSCRRRAAPASACWDRPPQDRAACAFHCGRRARSTRRRW